jgi:cyclophilin family peptidyl-prolyl cis-trans isomerase
MQTLITILIPLAILFMMAACDGAKPANAQGSGGPQDAKSRPTTGPTAEKPGKADNPVVKLETTEGAITLELDRKKAPITVDNFLSYVRKGHYDGTVFHRIMSNFMIQGGGMTEDGRQKDTDKPIKNEASNGLSNARGTIAMARTNDPNSATSQFFINVVDNSKLDYGGMTGAGYAVFGKVKDEASMKVVDAIKMTPTTGPEKSTPTRTVKITKATIISE